METDRSEGGVIETRRGERLLEVPGIDENGNRTTFYIMLNHGGEEKRKPQKQPS